MFWLLVGSACCGYLTLCAKNWLRQGGGRAQRWGGVPEAAVKWYFCSFAFMAITLFWEIWAFDLDLIDVDNGLAWEVYFTFAGLTQAFHFLELLILFDKPCVEPCYWPALSFATACTTSNIPMLSEKVDLIKDITFSIVLLKLGYHKLSALSICWTISCFGIFLLESFTPLLSSLPDTLGVADVVLAQPAREAGVGGAEDDSSF